MSIPLEPGDLDAGARTVWGEARSEGYVGMVAVAAVLANRVKTARAYVEKHKKPHPLFGNGTLKDACLRPLQFSCWNEGDPNLPKLKAVNTGDNEFCWALYAMLGVALGHVIDPTQGATHYVRDVLYDKAGWWRDMLRTTKESFGRHVFLKEKPWKQAA